MELSFSELSELQNFLIVDPFLDSFEHIEDNFNAYFLLPTLNADIECIAPLDEDSGSKDLREKVSEVQTKKIWKNDNILLENNQKPLRAIMDEEISSLKKHNNGRRHKKSFDKGNKENSLCSSNLLLKKHPNKCWAEVDNPALRTSFSEIMQKETSDDSVIGNSKLSPWKNDQRKKTQLLNFTEIQAQEEAISLVELFIKKENASSYSSGH